MKTTFWPVANGAIAAWTCASPMPFTWLTPVTDSYVEYEPRRILESLREAAERAVREQRITPAERFRIMQTFEDGLRGYTYFER